MRPQWRFLWPAELDAALRSGEFRQSNCFQTCLSCDTDDGTRSWTPRGVLCELAAREEIIPAGVVYDASDKHRRWRYREDTTNFGSSHLIPDAVLAAAGLRLPLGDPIVVAGVERDWSHHDTHGVTFEQFADALREAYPPPGSGVPLAVGGAILPAVTR